MILKTIAEELGDNADKEKVKMRCRDNWTQNEKMKVFK